MFDHSTSFETFWVVESIQFQNSLQFLAQVKLFLFKWFLKLGKVLQLDCYLLQLDQKQAPNMREKMFSSWRGF